MQARIRPLEPPYEAPVQALFDLVMPEGVEPLMLFRVLATNPRLFPRFMRAGVLDRGPVEIRHRELVIHRTTARCNAEYEWGVHASAFARPLGMSEEWIRATFLAGPEDPIWSPDERLLIRLCDELHDTSTLSEPLYSELAETFSAEQLQELIYSAGLYHAVSFLTNALALPNEDFGERFPVSPSSPG